MADSASLGATRSLGATGAEAPEAHASEPTNQPPVGTLVCLAVAATCSVAVLLLLQSHLTFFGDEWRFLLNRRGLSVDAFLDPHNEHIVLAPISIYKALLALFGMSSALPFQIVSTLVFLLSAVLLFLYLRLRVGDWPALLGSVLILFLGGGWVDLLWSFQIGFSGSIAAGIGALLALDRDDRKGDLVACALLVLSTSFSELGIPFAVGALVSVALASPHRLSRLYVALVPVALYGIWYLGWGHTAPNAASFDNFVDSPKFVFDAVSENLASLLGLATGLNGNPGPNLGGLDRGRILLVIAIALAIWRLRRVGWRSRWLWAVVAAGGAFWFLTALSAIPVRRTATSVRYQYPGAIFVLLIAAEILRGVRVDRRILAAATAVTVGAAISGLIFLHDGYETRKDASDVLRAKLAAVEIARGRESPNHHIGFSPTISIPPPTYFSAVDAFGSPAFSESRLAASEEVNRAAADQELAQAEGIKLGAVAPGAGQGARRCRKLSASSATQPLARLGPGRIMLETGGPSVPGIPAAVQVLLGRFSDRLPVALGSLQPERPLSLVIPADRSARRWRLGVAGLGQPVTLCRLRGV